MANPIEFKKAYEQAVEDRDVRKVLQIINRVEPGSIPTYAADALHFMCYYGSLDDIKTLIEKYKYPTDTQHRSHAFYGNNDYRYGYWDCNRSDYGYRGTLLHVVCFRYHGTEEEVSSILEYLINEVGLSTDVISEYGDGLPLHVACRHSLDRVKMVSVGCDVNRQDEAGNTPLHMAYQNGSTNMVRYLVEEEKCDFNVVNNKGELPLHLACKHEYDKEIVQLVSVGCDVNRQDEGGNTPLHMTCQNGNTDMVQYLVEEKKCDVNVANNKGELPLHLTCQHRHGAQLVNWNMNRHDKLKYKEIVQLVSLSCDVNRQDEAGNTPLHVACQSLNIELVTFLIKEKNCDVNVTNNKGELPLHLACEHKYGKEIVQLVSVGCDVNRQDEAGNTPLHMACQNGSTDIVGYLVKERKCDSSVANNKVELPLHLACKHIICDKEIVQLVSVGCDVNRQDEAGNTPLHMVCQNGGTDIVRYFVEERKCDSSVANNKGELPLHLAYKLIICDKEILQLVSVGCDVNRQDEAGNTPLHMACQNGSTDIVRYFVEERKCDFNLVNNKGELPLHLACKHKYGKEIVQLMSVGCDVNRQDEAGNTPLHIACRNIDTGIVKFLVEERKCVVDHVALNICGIEADKSHSSLYASLWTSKHTIKSKQCGLTLLNAESNTRTLFEEAFRNKDYDACLGLMMVGQCDVYTQIEGIDKCDVVHTLLREYTFRCGIACTRPTDLMEGDTILHVASYNCQSALIKHLIHVLKFSPNIVNSKQECPLHIACRSGCSLKGIELLARCGNVDHQDIDGNTPLHLACQRHDVITARFLVKERHCSNAIVNNKGELPLHFACNSNSSINEIELVSLDCDVNRQDNAGNTPLHLACGSGKSDIVKFLIEEKRCSTDVVNNAGELPLHLACRYWIGLSEVKLMSNGCSPNVTTKEGDTVLHEFCLSSSEDLEIIKFLCDEFGCDPNLSNLRGERPLHLACHRGCDRVVEYLVPKVDIDERDNANRTPLMCCPLDHPNIIRTLIEYGADPQHLYKIYQEFFQTYSSEKPPGTPLNVIVVGNPSSGKSTLIKALKSEGCQDMVHAEAFTAGIIPSAYESESFGSVIWYDLAGQSEYYASHEAILHTILSASPPLVLLLVDIRQDLKYIQQDILYWLNFLHCQFGTESGTRPHLVIVLSFADKSPIWESEEKTRSIRENLEPNFIKFQSMPVSIIALDCRMPNSDEIVSLRSQLSASFKELCDRTKMNFNLHCFYAFLLYNFKSLTAITINDVLTLSSNWISSGIDPRYFNEDEEEANSESIDSDDDSIPEFNEEESPARLLPAKHEDILILCKELHNKGHIILLKNKSEVEKSWLIMQKEVLLNKVNGSLFAPQHFRQHFKELSTNTGVVTLSGLVKHFPHHDPDMLIGFLTHMEFCQEINDEVILQLLTESDLKSKDPQRYFFFPGLVSIEKPEQIWKDNGDYSNKCGWIVEATQANEFFTPRFLQVLQLRIAFNFPLSVVNRRIIGFDPPTIQRCCSVWKNGISWKTESGLECLIEVTEQCQAVVLMLRSISSSRDLTSHYISYRSSLIKVITSAVSDICPSLEVSESFCHPDHIQYPPQECEKTALYSLPSIARTICKQVQLVLCDNSEHDSIKLEKLVTFEPFFHFNIHQLFNSPEKDNVITDDYLRRVSKSICSNEAGRTVYMMFTQEQNIPADLKLSADAIFEVLVDWRDSKHATYSDLHCHLSQYSIFCDRDPQVRMEC